MAESTTTPNSSAAPRKVKVGLVQEKWHVDPQEHAEALRRGVLKAAAAGAQLVVLQELTLHRYFGDRTRGDPEVLALAEEIGTANVGPTSQLCSRLAKEAGVYLVGSLFEKDLSQLRKNGIAANATGGIMNDGVRYYNTAVIFNPQGELAHVTRKQHIPSGAGYNETDFFEPGDSDYPVHDLGFIKVAIPTCYDQWFPELARIYALKGAEFIVYPTAIGSEPEHPGFDSQPMWQKVMTGHAIANGVFIGAVNRVGNEGMVTLYGSSFVVDPMGNTVVQASRTDPEVLVAELDFGVFDFWRSLFPLCNQRRPETYSRLLQN